jgi:dephospho-CoA kinase
MNERTRTIGVAGYMGAGKSVVCATLARDGDTVIIADAVAKELMTSDPALPAALREAFGEEIIDDGSTISFGRLGAKVFASRSELERLNAIVHPPLVKRLRALVDSATTRRCILDAALIPLWGIEKWFDYRIWVTAPLDTRVRRLMDRDGRNREEVRRRAIMQQELFGEPDERQWIIVHNEGTIEELERSIACHVLPIV